jgi:hypothetical protein
VDDLNSSVGELLEIGARNIDIGQNSTDTHVVLADLDNNEFCVIEPNNQYFASCPRLGAVNCDGSKALGYFFSAALGWPLVWDLDDETAIQAPDGTGPKIQWNGPSLSAKLEKERLHFHLAPSWGSSVHSTLEYLLILGAKRRASVQGCLGAIVLADVDGNNFCLLDE